MEFPRRHATGGFSYSRSIIEYVPRYNILFSPGSSNEFSRKFHHPTAGGRLRAADSAAIWAIGYSVIPEGSSRTEREKGKAARPSARVVRSWRQVEGCDPLPLLSSRPAHDSSYPAWRPAAVGFAIAAVVVTITQYRRRNFAITMEGSAAVAP